MSRVLCESVTYRIDTNHGFIHNKVRFVGDGYEFIPKFVVDGFGTIADAAVFSFLEIARNVFFDLRKETPDLTVLHIYEERTVLRTPGDELDLILQEFNK